MSTEELFSDSAYANEMHVAEGELSAFIRAVKELYGPEQATLSAEDWLDESELIDSAPRSTSRDWRAVTIAASARLADRLNVAPRQSRDGAEARMNVLPAPNRFAPKLLA
jgi:hypothetical protein